MKKALLFTLLFASALIANETVKIGAILALTGSNSSVDEHMRDGMLLRLQEQKARPSKFNYEVVVEDDGGSQVNAVLAYRKISNINKCEVIFDTWSGPGNAIAPLAARDKKLVFGSAWDGHIAADSLAFLHLTPPEPQARLIAQTLNALGVKKVAIICMVQQGTLAMEKAFVAEASRLGLQTQTRKFNPGEIDFRGHLLQLRDFNADAYLELAFEPEFSILYQRIHEEKKNAVITAVEGFNFCNDLKPYNGRFYVEGNEMSDEFKKKIERQTGHPALGYFGNGYDIMDLIIYAYETAGAKLGRRPTTAEAADILRTLKNYPGAIGPLTMGENRVIQSPAVLKYIENGKAELITVDELKKRLNR